MRAQPQPAGGRRQRGDGQRQPAGSSQARGTDASARSPAAGEVPDMVLGARSLARHGLRPVLALWLRLRVEGRHNIPDDGPVLIASTHQSHADSVAIGVAVRRPVRFLGDARLLAWRIVGPALPRLGMVPLLRGQGDAAALGMIGDLLADGSAVAVYPEGSRSRDGRVHRLRSGLARLAAATHTPVVPTAVAGIYDVWPIGQRPRLRGGRVTVRFGEPLAPPRDQPRDRREFTQELHHRLAGLAGVEAADDFSPIGGDR